MRTGSLALRSACAAAVVAALAVTPVLGAAPARAALARPGDSVRITVTPAVIAPGAEIEIRVDGCASRYGTATSWAFAGPAGLAGRERGGKTRLFGDTTIRISALPGMYEITARCDGRGPIGTGLLQVVPWEPGHHEWPGDHEWHEWPSYQERPSHHASPVAPVRAGGGGTAVLAWPGHAVGAPATAADSADGSGPGVPQAVIGLVLAGVAAGAVVFRSVRRRRSASRDTD